MSFGVNNACTIFMDYINIIFFPFLDHFVIIFITDIFIYFKTFKEYEEHTLKREPHNCMLNYLSFNFD